MHDPLLAPQATLQIAVLRCSGNIEYSFREVPYRIQIRPAFFNASIPLFKPPLKYTGSDWNRVLKNAVSDAETQQNL